jgi:hypothetical protein
MPPRVSTQLHSYAAIPRDSFVKVYLPMALNRSSEDRASLPMISLLPAFF